MSDTATTEQVTAGADDEQGGGGRKKLVLIAVAVVLAGLAAYLSVMAPSGSAEPDTVASPEPVASPGEGPVLEIATMTVNLEGDASRFARVGFAAVLSAEVLDAEAVEGRFPLLKDAAITVISGFTPEELVTHAGQEGLRDGLTAAARDLYPDDEVARIVLTELIVQ